MSLAKVIKVAVPIFALSQLLTGCFDSSSGGSGSTSQANATSTPQEAAPLTDITSLSFSDPALEACVKATSQQYAEKIESLVCNNKGIQHLDGIEELSELKTLFVSFNEISDITPVGELSKLKTLYVNGNNIQDISALSDLENLNALGLQYNDIQDISSLSSKSQLKSLHVRKNAIIDFSSLEGLSLEKFSGKNEQQDS